ncbi:Salicylaldehyde dehydrogenase [Lachnellula willkommii]|uniref:Salicylaldehyde dehydrogenase n=1 Tax=Lachnellula willkommii TaxID=215461 RepID=A0A559M6Q5_9HELO|nr:Salicylaldehyde dehydrogenase [Lachnellula willkommii]
MSTKLSEVKDMKVVPFLIDGKHETTGARTFPIISNQLQRELCLAQSADSTTAFAAADSASKAFKTWKHTPWMTRRDILLRTADIIRRRETELKETMVAETSCTAQWAEFQIEFTINIIRETASKVSSLVGEIPAMASPSNSFGFIFREALGPILLIAPWNAPTILSGRSLASIIGAGCTVVFKASELSPKTHHMLVEAFLEAGVPSGVINVIQTAREDAAGVTETLISHPAIRKVEFIGSAGVGSKIAELAGKYLKPLLMEMGDKAAAIVLEDAGMEASADICIFGEFADNLPAFVHHGQVCFGTERVIIMKSVAENFIQLLKKKAESFHAGIPVTASMSKGTHDKLVDAQSKGAEFILGGPQYGEKHSLVPSIVTGVTKDMTMWNEETFGPCLAVYIVDSDEEATELVNDTPYGFSTSIHTKDLTRALNMSKELDVGQVQVNGTTVHSDGKHVVDI